MSGIHGPFTEFSLAGVVLRSLPLAFPAVGVTTGVTAFGVDDGVICDGGGMVALYGKAFFGISGREFGISGRFGTTSKDF